MKLRSLATLLCVCLAIAGCEELWDAPAPELEAGAGSPPDASSAPPAAMHGDAQADGALDPAETASDATIAGTRVPDAALADASVPDASASAADAAAPDPSSPPFAVGTARVEINARDGRVLPVQLWYPASEAARAESSAGHPASELEPPGARRELLERLFASAPQTCVNRRMHAAFDAGAHERAAPYPLLVYSHHLEGMRFAMFSAAEALAARGFVVAAPDHASMTLFDRTDDLQTADLLGQVWRFRLDALVIRAADIEDVIGALLLRDAPALPPDMRGKIDAARVGVFGHSMGSMTAGVVAARDARVKAAAYLSFPPATLLTLLNLLDQPAIESFRVPALFMLNQEDAPLNAVGGNDAIRAQFEAHPPAARLVEVRDTGHWSFADDCGLIPDFADGCGRGTRGVEPYEPYDNLDNGVARAIAARELVAFFGEQFLGAPAPSDVPGSEHELVNSHAQRAARR